MQRKITKIDNHGQIITLDKGKIKDASCTCRWMTIHRKAWEDNEKICKHLIKSLKLLYTQDWRKISKKTLENSKCDICKTKENLILHHKDEDKMNNKMSNLIPLCNKCHSKVHTKMRFYKNNHAEKPYNRIKEMIR